MKKQEFLWQKLGLDCNFKCSQLYSAYQKQQNKTSDIIYAYKVLKDKFYRNVYKKYLSSDMLYNAGFFVDSLPVTGKNNFALNLLTTPFGKILNNINSSTKNPVVLLSTGGFNPIHMGHVNMMDIAKVELEKNGYNVVGGYFSLSHDDYVTTKPYNKIDVYQRLDNAQKYIKDSSYLMIDPWECMYAKTYLNFTDVITRLEKYLKKHVNKNIKVAYVFGADNAQFMHCFEDFGMGVCVYRDGYDDVFEKTKLALKNNRCFFVKDLSYSNLSSRDIRKQDSFNVFSVFSPDGDYTIRNEGLLPLQNYLKVVDKNTLEKQHKMFLDRLVELFKNVFDSKLNVSVLNLNEQLELANVELKNKKCISLDTYYKGTYNIETSRLFDVSEYQKNYLYLTARPGFDDIKNQISQIEPGGYVLVDDDSATGKTINEVLSLLPTSVKIVDKFLLASMLKNKIYDIVDLRDFIVGSQNGGLIVRLDNTVEVRAPYILPYVCLKTRASVPAQKEKQFSLELWRLNAWFYASLGKNVTLKYADIEFQKLMQRVGFDKNVSMVDICKWHIKNLK